MIKWRDLSHFGKIFIPLIVSFVQIKAKVAKQINSLRNNLSIQILLAQMLSLDKSKQKIYIPINFFPVKTFLNLKYLINTQKFHKMKYDLKGH